jgi:hypothetical protein
MQEPRMDTYKRFPRTLEEAFPDHYREQFDPLYQPPHDRTDPDVWVMLACAFAAGFLTGLIVWA